MHPLFGDPRFGNASQAALRNVLTAFTVYNPRLGYCQGMNFIAGLFYLVYEEEDMAFAMFASLIERENMAGLYIEGVPLLSQQTYQLNRLMAIYLPALHNHLYEEKINAVYFSSGWFITCFAYVIQYTKDLQLPLFLLSIFDKLLIVLVGER
eukprot:TRINITY_DN2060_c0_g1_i7.p2 TRINITY_DN2060_c0_g1~~TRINITY_DN2060_c0_g1_i7.p2  ORF type:complete len:152 (-),score=28.64 TRINITY_DN2060_c0_g1_i7:452-907(-)